MNPRTMFCILILLTHTACVPASQTPTAPEGVSPCPPCPCAEKKTGPVFLGIDFQSEGGGESEME